MKSINRKSIIVVALLMASFSSMAQFFVGGSVELTYSNSKNEQDDGFSSDNNGITLGVLPELGYCFSEKFEMGLGFDVRWEFYEVKTNYPENVLQYLNINNSTKTTSNTYGAYAFGQYNCIQNNGFTLGAMVEGRFYGNKHYKEYDIYLKPVFEYALNDKFSIKTTLGNVGYCYQKYDGDVVDKWMNFNLLGGCTLGVKYKL